ncbi:hypothetical protein ACWEGQ_20050 [Streptomyces seoulensis]
MIDPVGREGIPAFGDLLGVGQSPQWHDGLGEPVDVRPRGAEEARGPGGSRAEHVDLESALPR